MNKPTSSPWEFWDRKAPGDLTITDMSGKFCIARLEPNVPHLDETRANGRLIACAPELLGALKVMLDQIDDDPRASQFFDLRLIERSRAIIAKAEGRF
jgi:hypothetical protein